MHALILLSLVASASPGAEEVHDQLRRLSIGGGLVSAAQVDRGYSPLVFSGLHGSTQASYSRVRGRRERTLAFEYSSGVLRNQHGRSLDATSLSWSVATLYRRGETGAISWGWVQSNLFNNRTIDGFLNYTGRTDYFSSVGPAMKYSAPFRVLNQEFAFRALGHVQLLGVYLPSGYVSSMPKGFGYEQRGLMSAILNSVFVFHPGSAIAVGLRPALHWNLSENSSLGLSYLYDYHSLRNVHPSRSSRGTFSLSLEMGI